MKFYTYHNGNEALYFRRKDEALKDARANTLKGEEVDVEQIDIGTPNADRVCAILNQQQFVEDREFVKTVKGNFDMEDLF